MRQPEPWSCASKVRPVTAKVVDPPEKKPVIEDLAAEVAKLKGAAGRREEAFQKSFAAEKNQGNVLNRKFDELLKQAKESPDTGAPPKRPFDFD